MRHGAVVVDKGSSDMCREHGRAIAALLRDRVGRIALTPMLMLAVSGVGCGEGQLRSSRHELDDECWTGDCAHGDGDPDSDGASDWNGDAEEPRICNNGVVDRPCRCGSEIVESGLCCAGVSHDGSDCGPIQNRAPTAATVDILGTALEGRTLVGAYRYEDEEQDPEGSSSFRWLRDGVAIPGATSKAYVTTGADRGSMIELEVTPVATSGTLLGKATRSPTLGPIRNTTLSSTDETLTEHIEFTTTDHASSLFANNIQTGIFTHHGVTYFVYVNAAFHPVVGSITDGAVSTSVLDASYSVVDDGHYTFAIGVGPDGYVQVMGNMHNSGVTQHWISDAPLDITQFSFVGDDAALTLPGHGYSYTAFRTDMDGTLYLRARGHTTNQQEWTEGLMGWMLYRYEPATRTWIALGGKQASQVPTALYESVFWENTGAYYAAGNNSVYQGFMSDLQFDANSRMHVAAAIADVPTLPNASHMLYAYSDDGGQTFRRADDSTIGPLPMRVEAGSSQPDVLADMSDLNSSGVAEGYWSHTGIGLDLSGSPLVLYSVINTVGGAFGYDPEAYNLWDPAARVWSARKTDPMSGLNGEQPLLDADGIFIWQNADARGLIKRTYHHSEPGYEKQLYGMVRSYDVRAVREQGVVRFWRQASGAIQVVSLSSNPTVSSLPARWTTSFLGDATGGAGVFNNVYRFDSSGNGFAEAGKNLQFTHQVQSGDFSIEARILSVEYTHPAALGGLVISSDSTLADSFAAIMVTAGSGLWTRHRAEGGLEDGLSMSDIEASEWLRVSRRGDAFTLEHSANGREWQVVDSVVIAMPAEVHTGVISAGVSRGGLVRIDKLRVAP